MIHYPKLEVANLDSLNEWLNSKFASPGVLGGRYTFTDSACTCRRSPPPASPLRKLTAGAMLGTAFKHI
ncbi:unnamed protein product [Acanthoscelides obtectus]|uniref:Uncharacterized protein n=1 Tax=Acanthoscelides obtectus TaxID=200917 RepID=A0A9P0LW13_ACAOB|nr:unnamed protein product [Acanthoscelides obtectus]CAK1629262.1 hypothetical protein AOBTE_LOCUS5641 [Acanthoscelides obtectus]